MMCYSADCFFLARQDRAVLHATHSKKKRHNTLEDFGGNLLSTECYSGVLIDPKAASFHGSIVREGYL